MDPEVLDVGAKGNGAPGKLGLMVVLVPLILSAIGNFVQWHNSGAEVEKLRAEASQAQHVAAKTAAEIERVRQEQAANGERLVQSWLEVLKKFDTPEDRAMVLSAAIATSSESRVKDWARSQLQVVEQALAERKRIAEAQLALAAAPGPASATSVPSASSNPVNAGQAQVSAGTTEHTTAVSGMAAMPTLTKNQNLAVRDLAARDLVRIRRAEAMLKSAK